jgi:hypothetical protein
MPRAALVSPVSPSMDLQVEPRLNLCCRVFITIEEFNTLAAPRDRAVVRGSVMKMQVAVDLLRVLLKAIRDFDAQIEEVFEQHPDASLF